MLQHAKSLLAEEGITELGLLPISAVRVLRPELFCRAGDFTPKSVLLYLIPYYTGPADNLSLYAVSRDYHRYVRALGEELSAALSAAFPGASFRNFTDHSPIDERHAAVLAGLGFFGDNGLLIHPRYGSLVFIGELFSDLPAPSDTPLFPLVGCEHCGACRRACPTGALSGEGECLSELTQRKGVLSPETVRLMRRHHTVWGCDLCQTACPHTRRAIASGTVSPIPFFHASRIPHLDSATLAAMPKEEFEMRAFAWRGRSTVERNLKAYEADGE
ncbi:MAG: epoxyqueuosine reductase [Clostridia bacterium]|nr:epoxyqueuosine reductase [Clostridia bacterium]